MTDRISDNPLINRHILDNKNSSNPRAFVLKSWVRNIKDASKAQYLSWLVAITFIFSSFPPFTANAGIFSSISDMIFGNSSQVVIASGDQAASDPNDIPLLQNTTNFDTLAAVGGDDLVFDNSDEALVSENGPSGTLADIPSAGNTGQISKYIVRSGDTISGIAKMFGVSQNTILWANNLNSSVVQPGQALIILPVSGTIHTIVSGDTITSIAKKYKADAGEVAVFNGLSLDAKLTVGGQIIIPDGEGGSNISATLAMASKSGSNSISEPYLGGSGPNEDSYYIRPLVGGVRTQGLHGWNAIDIGTPVGTRVMAAASGEIIVAKSSGWNGGYGNYIVISHPNGTETVYGHLSQVLVSSGQSVVQGQVIGLSGNTGYSTGPHLHFEVRGAHNPLAN